MVIDRFSQDPHQTSKPYFSFSRRGHKLHSSIGTQMKSSVASAIAVFEEKLATRNTRQGAGSEHAENNLRHSMEGTKSCRSKRRSSLAAPLPGKDLNSTSAMHAMDSNGKIATSTSLQQGSKQCVSPLRRRNSLVVPASPKVSQVVDYSKFKAGLTGCPVRLIAPNSAPSSPSKFSASRPHRRSSMSSMDHHHQHPKSSCRDSMVEVKNSSHPTDQRRSTKSNSIPHKVQVSPGNRVISTSDFASLKGQYVMKEVRRKAIEPSLQSTSVHHESKKSAVSPKMRRHSIIGSTAGASKQHASSPSSNNKVAPTISQYEAMLAGKKESKSVIYTPIAKKGRRSSITNSETSKGNPNRWDTSIAQKNSPAVSSPKKQSGRKNARLPLPKESNGDDSFGVDSLADITEAFAELSSPTPLEANMKSEALRNQTLDLPFASSEGKSEVCFGDSENECRTAPTSQDGAMGPPLRSSRQWNMSFYGMTDAAVSIAAEHSIGNEEEATVPPLRPSREWNLSFYGSVPLADIVDEKFNAEAVDTNSTASSAASCESSKRPPKRPVREMMRPVPRAPDQIKTGKPSRKKPDPSSSFLETSTASTTASVGSASNTHPSDEDSTNMIQGERKIVQNDKRKDVEDDVISALTEDNSAHFSTDDRRFPSWNDLLRSRQRANRKKADAAITKLCSGSLSIKDRLIQFQRRGPGL